MPMHTEAERRKKKKEGQAKSFSQHVSDFYEAAKRIMPGGIFSLTREKQKGQTHTVQEALDMANRKKRKKGN